MADRLLDLVILVCFVMSIYGLPIFFVRMFQAYREFDPKLRRAANFFPFLVLLRGAYSEQGRRYFDLAVKNFLIAAIGMAILLFVTSM